MVYEILVGWCTIHGLIWFSLAVLLFAIGLYIHHVRWERRSWPPEPPPVRVPSWAREKVASPKGRHRKS